MEALSGEHAMHDTAHCAENNNSNNGQPGGA